MRTNIQIGGNKKQIFNLIFYLNLSNTNVGGSVNQSNNKKALLEYTIIDNSAKTYSLSVKVYILRLCYLCN